LKSTLQMKLKSFNYFYSLLIIFFFFSPLKSEEKIKIWNNKEKKQSTETKKIENKDVQKLDLDSIKEIDLKQSITIEDKPLDKDTNKANVFGIYDPADNNFNLNMW